MMGEVQSRKMAKYRNLAKKNRLCRYLATVMLIMDVVTSKFFSYHRRYFVSLGQLCLVMFVFLTNTSFTPPTFGENNKSEMLPVSYEYVEEKYVEDEYEEVSPLTMEEHNRENAEAAEHLHDEHALVNTDEVAGLDDLIEKSKDSGITQITTGVEGTVAANGNGAENPAQETAVIFSKDDWKLLLVNKQHTIPEDYQFTLGTIKGSMRCDERIIEPLTQMFAEAKEDGVTLVVCSPYRDLERQEYLFERKVKNYQKTGMSYMDAYKKASITVTVPGASEHQVGLAVDIISDTYTSLDIGFEDTDAGKWLKEHSWEYGFILRYPEGKEEITGIQYEPWHFRYVGVDAAQVITSQNITLEEFVENL